MNLKELKKTIPFKWKIQTVKHWGCACVAYIDARAVMDRLDDVVGPENWQDEYYPVNGRTYCKLGLRIDREWLWKSDCGAPSQMDAEKGEASDALKRAAVKWGIGRFLYDLDIVWLATMKGQDGKFYPVHKPMSGPECPPKYLKNGAFIKDVNVYIKNVLKK